MTVGVVIPVKDNWPYTSALLEQLADQDEYGDIVVFDNGSTDGTPGGLEAWAASDPDRHWFTRKPNVGIHAMWNAGLAYHASLGHGDVAVLNNDLSIGPNFLSRLAVTLRSEPDIAIACPNYDRRLAYGPVDVQEICAGRYDGTGGMPGFAFMVRSEDGYRFPEWNWWYGDNDLLLTHLVAGRRCVIDPAVSCEHLDGGSRTGDWDDPDMQRLLAADQAAFAEKWSHLLAPAST